MIIEKGKCEIESINSKGLGVGKTALGVVELPYTLPKEIVEFERHRYRNQSNCTLKSIIQTSSNRTIPQCKYFGACGGCLLQHLNSDSYSEFKHNLIRLTISARNIETTINPIVSIPFGLRRRANLEVVKKRDQIFLGFHRYHSHQIINIDQCPAILPSLSNLLDPLKSVFYQILSHKQKAQIFLNEVNNGIDIKIILDSQLTITDQQRSILLNFAIEYKITRISVHVSESLYTIYEIEHPYVNFAGINVEVDANSFLQSSFLSDKILTDLVLEFLLEDYDNSKNTRIVDLFCGRGTFTLPLSNYFKVDGVDVDQEAIKALKRASYQTINSITLTERNLFTHPISKGELSKYKYAVINPPRSGCESQCTRLAISNIEKICYISCSPETFSFDAKILCSSGYKLVKIIPVDQFYYSPHLEVIGFFKR